MSNTILPGTALFIKNRSGSHNWLENHSRPFFNIVETKDNGKRRYTDLFLNQYAFERLDVTDVDTDITIPANHIIMVIRCDCNKPLGRVLNRTIRDTQES